MEFLNETDRNKVKYKLLKTRIPIGLIDFMFDCWSIQRFTDASGKQIPKNHAISSIKKFSKNWDDWLTKTPYHYK